MSKQRILMVVAICFVLLGTVAAGRGRRSEPKPDSVVGCFMAGGGPYGVFALTVPESIDESSCTPGAGDPCSPCIRSLENQGCEVIEPVRTKDELVLGEGVFQFSTFVLSCEQP